MRRTTAKMDKIIMTIQNAVRPSPRFGSGDTAMAASSLRNERKGCYEGRAAMRSGKEWSIHEL